jgi:hypothetical protein
MKDRSRRFNDGCLCGQRAPENMKVNGRDFLNRRTGWMCECGRGWQRTSTSELTQLSGFTPQQREDKLAILASIGVKA